jgi:hypothetical protein
MQSNADARRQDFILKVSGKPFGQILNFERLPIVTYQT